MENHDEHAKKCWYCIDHAHNVIFETIMDLEGETLHENRVHETLTRFTDAVATFKRVGVNVIPVGQKVKLSALVERARGMMNDKSLFTSENIVDLTVVAHKIVTDTRGVSRGLTRTKSVVVKTFSGAEKEFPSIEEALEYVKRPKKVKKMR